MAEGKKKQKKSPWWYKLGILVFGAVFAYYCMFAAVAFELAAAVYYTFQLK